MCICDDSASDWKGWHYRLVRPEVRRRIDIPQGLWKSQRQIKYNRRYVWNISENFGRSQHHCLDPVERENVPNFWRAFGHLRYHFGPHYQTEIGFEWILLDNSFYPICKKYFPCPGITKCTSVVFRWPEARQWVHIIAQNIIFKAY